MPPLELRALRPSAVRQGPGLTATTEWRVLLQPAELGPTCPSSRSTPSLCSAASSPAGQPAASADRELTWRHQRATWGRPGGASARWRCTRRSSRLGAWPPIYECSARCESSAADRDGESLGAWRWAAMWVTYYSLQASPLKPNRFFFWGGCRVQKVP